MVKPTYISLNSSTDMNISHSKTEKRRLISFTLFLGSNYLVLVLNGAAFIFELLKKVSSFCLRKSKPPFII